MEKALLTGQDGIPRLPEGVLCAGSMDMHGFFREQGANLTSSSGVPVVDIAPDDGWSLIILEKKFTSSLDASVLASAACIQKIPEDGFHRLAVVGSQWLEDNRSLLDREIGSGNVRVVLDETGEYISASPKESLFSPRVADRLPEDERERLSVAISYYRLDFRGHSSSQGRRDVGSVLYPEDWVEFITYGHSCITSSDCAVIGFDGYAPSGIPEATMKALEELHFPNCEGFTPLFLTIYNASQAWKAAMKPYGFKSAPRLIGGEGGRGIIKALGDEIGVESFLDAVYAGVPVEDLGI